MEIRIHTITEQERQIITAAVQVYLDRYRVVLIRDDGFPRCPLDPQEADRAIYSAACQAIADVSRFTGNLSRISDPANRRKTAELLRDAFTQLAQDMDVVIDATGR